MHPPRFVLAALVLPSLLTAAVIGTNPPALPVTAERVAATLPAVQQKPWLDYIARSAQLMAADKAFFAAELKAHNLTTGTTPPESRGDGLSLEKPAAWYASDEAKKIADNVLSFQTPAGGWSKNMNFAKHGRQPGEFFAAGNLAPVASKPDDNDAPHDPAWHYVGTFDNDATITQLRFLAKVCSALDATQGAAYRASFLRGLEYMLVAQFPNGGWPQVYPLEGGYHDTITFNDNALINVITILRDISENQADFTFVSADLRARAAASVKRGVGCILACQIKVGPTLTGWGQQHDALTLASASARNYEMPSQSGGESAATTTFLMSLPNPSPEIIAAVHSAAAWFKKTAIHNAKWGPAPDGSGRTLVKSPGDTVWARYYEIGTDRPLFGDRDKSIHDDVNEISKERRNGYAWYGTGPNRVLEHYEKWAKQYPAAKA